MKKYLFIRESDGAKIYGDTDGSLNTGGYRIEPNREKTEVTVYDRLNRDSSESPNMAISDFLKENGEPYTSYSELDSAFAAFFFRVGNSSGFGTVRITGTGSTDYEAPDDLKVGGAIFALNPADAEVSSILVDDVATIRFVVAPEAGDFPLVVYTKK